MAKPIPPPTEDDIRSGWSRNYDFINTICEKTESSGWDAGFEETEAVINALIELGHLTQSE